MVKAFHNLTIQPADPDGHYSRLFLDEQPLKGVTSLKLEMGVDHIPIATMTMQLNSVDATVMNGYVVGYMKEDRDEQNLVQ